MTVVLLAGALSLLGTSFLWNALTLAFGLWLIALAHASTPDKEDQ